MKLFSEQELIAFMVNSANFLELLAVYFKNIDQLHDYTILVFDDNITEEINKNPPLDITNKLKETSVVSVFRSSFCILNEFICSKMTTCKQADFEYKYCFDLDVNMMNALVDYHRNATGSVNSNSIVCDLNLINNDISCCPYMLENANKLENVNLEKHVIDTLLIFNKFKHSTLSNFTLDCPNEEVDFRNTKETIDTMKKIAMGELGPIINGKKYIYALLLKTAIISFSSTSGIKLKTVELLEFVNNSLGLFLEREMVICYWFLKNKHDDRIKKILNVYNQMPTILLKRFKGCLGIYFT